MAIMNALPKTPRNRDQHKNLRSFLSGRQETRITTVTMMMTVTSSSTRTMRSRHVDGMSQFSAAARRRCRRRDVKGHRAQGRGHIKAGLCRLAPITIALVANSLHSRRMWTSYKQRNCITQRQRTVLKVPYWTSRYNIQEINSYSAKDFDFSGEVGLSIATVVMLSCVLQY